jgi:cobaltochelatase CobT
VVASWVVFGLSLIAAIFGLWLVGRLFDRGNVKVAADEPNLPYSAYTSEFDLVCRGRDMPDLLRSDGIERQSSTSLKLYNERDRIDAFSDAYEQVLATGLPDLGNLEGSVICFLLDLSGSIANELPELLGQLRGLCDHLTQSGANTAAYGFTTRGWRGGKAREKWINDGRPEYPGRLCALLHVVLKEFAHPADVRDWHGILRPDALRENIDGEAIEWAVERLAKITASKRFLVVISDGAPVDDSTIMQNGSAFLSRHLKDVVSRVTQRADMSIAAIGLHYRVTEVLSNSIEIERPADLVDGFVTIARGAGLSPTRS